MELLQLQIVGAHQHRPAAPKVAVRHRKRNAEQSNREDRCHYICIRAKDRGVPDCQHTQRGAEDGVPDEQQLRVKVQPLQTLMSLNPGFVSEPDLILRHADLAI